MALVPSNLPPDVGLSAIGGDNLAFGSRTPANEYALFLEQYSGKTKMAYQNAIGFAGMIPKTTMRGFQSEQFIYTSRVDGDYKAIGEYFTNGDDYRKTERSVTPDKPVYTEQAQYQYDLLMSQIPDTTIVSNEQGRFLARVEEVKALRAAAKACLGNAAANGTDNFAVYLGGDGTTDYGLAANRTQTLTGFTSASSLYSSGDGSEIHEALAAISASIWDLTGMSPAAQGYRFISYPGFYEWFTLTTEYKALINSDLNRAPQMNYGQFMADIGLTIQDIPMVKAGLAQQALLTNVTYGWKTGGGAGVNEPDFANKYQSDNSKLIGMVIAPDALHGAQVQGTMVQAKDSFEVDGLLMRGKTDCAFKPVDNTKAWAIVLAS